MFTQQMFLSRANEETLRETCFHNNVSPSAAARIQTPLSKDSRVVDVATSAD